eukprot:scpid96718/ scgid17117/ 
MQQKLQTIVKLSRVFPTDAIHGQGTTAIGISFMVPLWSSRFAPLYAADIHNNYAAVLCRRQLCPCSLYCSLCLSYTSSCVCLVGGLLYVDDATPATTAATT